MTKRAKRSVGTKILIGTNAIGDLSSIGSPSITQEELDVTTLDSDGGYREFIAGFKDPGEVAISGYFVPTDAGQAALYAALDSGDVMDFEIVYPADLGVSWSFQGIVTAYNVTAELEDAIALEATIRVSGKPTLNQEVSAGLSDLTLSGTDGTLSPAFAADNYYYVFDGVTSNSVTVTATGVGQTIRLYVDGSYQEDLESGDASGAIPLSGVDTRKLTIIANETGKAPVTYEIIVIGD